jgi:hypothetical protein
MMRSAAFSRVEPLARNGAASSCEARLVPRLGMKGWLWKVLGLEGLGEAYRLQASAISTTITVSKNAKRTVSMTRLWRGFCPVMGFGASGRTIFIDAPVAARPAALMGRGKAEAGSASNAFNVITSQFNGA